MSTLSKFTFEELSNVAKQMSIKICQLESIFAIPSASILKPIAISLPRTSLRTRSTPAIRFSTAPHNFFQFIHVNWKRFS